MQQPALSIALPFFNAAKTLASAIQSILDQSFEDWELILIDDGSTDNSLKIALSFDDKRIKVISDGENKGISRRLNQAANMARGQYFFRMDGDDLSFPNRLAVQYAYLETHPDIDLVASNVVYFKSEAEILGVLNVASEHDGIVARPYAGFYMPHPSWAGKRSWFVRNGYNPLFDGAEDQELLYRTHRMSKFACLEEPLLAYREVSRTLKKSIRRRLILAKGMLVSASGQHLMCEMVRIVMIVSVKILADVVNLKLGASRLRTPFSPAPKNIADFVVRMQKLDQISEMP